MLRHQSASVFSSKHILFPHVLRVWNFAVSFGSLLRVAFLMHALFPRDLFHYELPLFHSYPFFESHRDDRA